MVIPPTFADLGKCAKDLFDKGFNYGYAKIDLKTTAKSGLEFCSKGTSINETGKISGSLETKYKNPGRGLTLTEKWTTENEVTSEVVLENQLADGLKLTVLATISPVTGKGRGMIKSNYRRNDVNLTLESDFNPAGPLVQASAVYNYDGWLGGCQLGFDSSKRSLSKINLAGGYRGADYSVNCYTNNGIDFGGAIFHSVTPKLSTGVQLSWTAEQNSSRFGVAAKYDIDSQSCVRTKLNNVGQVGLCYFLNIGKGVKFTVSTLIEAQNINAGGHKFGFGLEFEL